MEIVSVGRAVQGVINLPLGVVAEAAAVDEQHILQNDIAKQVETPAQNKLLHPAGQIGKHDMLFYVAVFPGVVQNGAVHGNDRQPQLEIGEGLQKGGRGTQRHDRQLHAGLQQTVHGNAAVRRQLFVGAAQGVVQIHSKEGVPAGLSGEMGGVDRQSQ